MRFRKTDFSLNAIRLLGRVGVSWFSPRAAAKSERAPHRGLVGLCLVAIAWGRAQEPLNPPVPLMRAGDAMGSPGSSAVTLTAAQRAQELGFAAVAAGIYRQLLNLPGAGGDRAGLTLALATVLLDDGKAAESEQALADFTGLRGAAWHLRAALAAAQLKKLTVATAELAAMKFDELPEADRAWHYFLQALLAEAAGDPGAVARAKDFYQKAEKAATTELARARFEIAYERARLRLPGPVTKPDLDKASANYERFQGQATGYDFARSYAVMLWASGDASAATRFLQLRVLATLPAEERAWADEFRLLLGLIADGKARDGAGRTALVQLLEKGSDPVKQRMALQLLSNDSQAEPARGPFRAVLEKLIAATPPHPILESLRLFRAQVALAEKDFMRAETDARELLNNFPGSPLRVHAYGVLTGVAWEQGRFRLAADNANRARAELAASTVGAPEARAEARARLGVLEAEAWFRAGDTEDFRNAAIAYAAALRERPAGVAAGALMFQRVLSEIKAGALDKAQPLLDEMARDPAFGVEREARWQAEWTLARALQADGKPHDAYERVNKLLTTAPANAAALPAELRARMAWLQARLSLDEKQPEVTLSLVKQLAELPGGLDDALKTEIASTGALLAAEANFMLGREAVAPQTKREREAAALETLKKLRAEHGKSEAAIASYLVEAAYYASPEQGRIVDAQKLLTKLADDFPESNYAPYALYQAALQVEQLGQDESYREANRLLVDLVKKYPQSDLVFAAQLKEGDLLRNLKQFQPAQQIYQDLVTKFSRRNDVVLAQLALAECLNAQSAGNPAHLMSAQALFEQLRDRVDAPVDVRVEAGYNLGEVHIRRGNPDKALEVWWTDVVTPFLLGEPATAAKVLREESKGRYWMARTLLRVGEVYEKQEKLENAKQAWRLILQTKLPGESLAKERLARFGPPEAKP